MTESHKISQTDSRKASGLVRAFQGASSLLAGLAFPLGGWWIGHLGAVRTEQRLQHGCIFVLPGVEGKSSLPLQIARGLVEGGVASAIEIHDWTTGFWPLFAYHLRYERRARSQAVGIATRIMEYQERFPGRPTFLVGHSGGGGVAVLVLESLPTDCRVTAAMLLGPALSRRYDLTEALSRTEAGLWNFYSPLDLIFLTAGTFVFGTIDGRHDVSAGTGAFPALHICHLVADGTFGRACINAATSFPCRGIATLAATLAGPIECSSRIGSAR